MMMTKDRKAIVGFLDILGYNSIVNKMIQDIGFIKRFDDYMFGVTVDLLAINLANKQGDIGRAKEV